MEDHLSDTTQNRLHSPFGSMYRPGRYIAPKGLYRDFSFFNVLFVSGVLWLQL